MWSRVGGEGEREGRGGSPVELPTCCLRRRKGGLAHPRACPGCQGRRGVAVKDEDSVPGARGNDLARALAPHGGGVSRQHRQEGLGVEALARVVDLDALIVVGTPWRNEREGESGKGAPEGADLEGCEGFRGERRGLRGAWGSPGMLKMAPGKGLMDEFAMSSYIMTTMCSSL